MHAGALEAIVAAMNAHSQERLQGSACVALATLCRGIDDAGLSRKQRAFEAHALEAVLAAMDTFPIAEFLQNGACDALTNICVGFDRAALARRQHAIQLRVMDSIMRWKWHTHRKRPLEDPLDYLFNMMLKSYPYQVQYPG